MIKVGFIGAVSSKWMGGLNYYKNLLFALKTLESHNIETIVFLGKKTDESIKNMFHDVSQVVESSMFDRFSFHWIIWKLMFKLFNSSLLLEQLLVKHKIDVLSHSPYTNLKCCRVVSWIPDFQHIHLPNMFTTEEISERNQLYLDFAKNTHSVVLSSFDALKDFSLFAEEYKDKGEVLQFVSQPRSGYDDLTVEDKEKLFKKYDLKSPYFYIPNQFWKHKNHMLVCKALDILKKKDICIHIVCTGYLDDYRNTQHVAELKSFISRCNLTENIKLLGLVDYSEVFSLIKFSQAVINPSLFEGWSSTVEECKSVGKEMILSDLPVHIEQSPSSTFFNRHSEEDLAKVLSEFDCKKLGNVSEFNVKEKTQAFAHTYERIIMDVMDKSL